MVVNVDGKNDGLFVNGFNATYAVFKELVEHNMLEDINTVKKRVF